MPTAVFDMLGTFFSLEPLRSRLAGLKVPGDTLELWLAESLRDFFAILLGASAGLPREGSQGRAGPC